MTRTTSVDVTVEAPDRPWPRPARPAWNAPLGEMAMSFPGQRMVKPTDGLLWRSALIETRRRWWQRRPRFRAVAVEFTPLLADSPDGWRLTGERSRWTTSETAAEQDGHRMLDEVVSGHHPVPDDRYRPLPPA